MFRKASFATILLLAVLITGQSFIFTQKAMATQQTVNGFEPDKPSGGQDVVVDMPKYTAVFAMRGGSLKSLKLKEYTKDCVDCSGDLLMKVKGLFTDKSDPKRNNGDLVELVNVRNGMPYPLTVTFPGSDVPNGADVLYAAALSPSRLGAAEKRQLVLTGTAGNLKIEKTFTFDPAGYVIPLSVKIHNLLASPVAQTPVISWHQVAVAQTEKNYGHDGPISMVGVKPPERKRADEVGAESFIGPDVRWAGYESKYFISSFIPETPSLANAAIARDADGMITVSLRGQKELIPGGQNVTLSYTIYVGPKKYSYLQSLGVGLENSVEFGWFRLLSVPLLILLNFLYGFVGNYGVAIVLMTVLIKLVFLPLGSMGAESQKAMRELKPQIENLKIQYKGDRVKLGEATMALYKEKKVSPLSGILPVLIQIPVFFGLYRTLMYAVELRQAPFFGWIQDLSARDPFYLVPVLMGISQFVVQKITPSAGSDEMKKVLLWLPVLFTFLFMSFPAGLVIYWMVNNLLQIGQQLYLNKKLGLNDVVTPEKQSAAELAAETK